jgi:hypothetical protein
VRVFLGLWLKFWFWLKNLKFKFLKFRAIPIRTSCTQKVTKMKSREAKMKIFCNNRFWRDEKKLIFPPFLIKHWIIKNIEILFLLDILFLEATFFVKQKKNWNFIIIYSILTFLSSRWMVAVIFTLQIFFFIVPNLCYTLLVLLKFSSFYGNLLK